MPASASESNEEHEQVQRIFKQSAVFTVFLAVFIQILLVCPIVITVCNKTQFLINQNWIRVTLFSNKV